MRNIEPASVELSHDIEFIEGCNLEIAPAHAARVGKQVAHSSTPARGTHCQFEIEACKKRMRRHPRDSHLISVSIQVRDGRHRVVAVASTQ